MVDQKIIDHYADMDIDELEMELEDIENAIENEKGWLRVNKEMEAVVAANIMKLRKEAAYVRKLIKELVSE